VSRPSAEEGAATVLVAALLAVTALLALGLGRLGAAAVDRARVDAVADLVALAAVTGDADGARRVANAAGASVVSLADGPAGRRTVTVRLRGSTSVAAAAPDSPGHPVIPG
jgi:hypothetical protein